jgi:hypothetical protein
VLALSDSIGSDDVAALHEDDTSNPIDPETLPDRLAAAGFTDVDVRVDEFGFVAHARKT